MVKPSPFICFSLIHVQQVLELKWKLRELGRETKGGWVVLAAKNNKQTPPRGQEACGHFHQNRGGLHFSHLHSFGKAQTLGSKPVLN